MQCDDTPPAGPHYLNLLNHSWPSDRLVVSLISGQGYHISLRTRKTQHTLLRGWKKREHGLGLAPSARRETFATLLRSFLCICGLSWECIRAKFPQIHRVRWLILSRPNPASKSTGPRSRLLSPTDCPVLSTSVQLWDVPSLVLFRSRRRSRAQALCVGFAPKQTKESSGWPLPTPTETNATHHVTAISGTTSLCANRWLIVNRFIRVT